MTTDTLELSREIPGIGTLTFIESEKRHEYWLLPEGHTKRKRLPSVTTIIRGTWPKPALLQWYAREGAAAEGLLAQAALRGKAVHRFVEHYLTTGEILGFDQFSPDCHGYLQGIARFLYERDPKPIATELLVCHPELNYAGRLDSIALVDDIPTLLDFKSNPQGRVYPEPHVQCVAYMMANERCGGEGPAPERTMIVGISEDGGVFPVLGELDVTRKVWASALDFYKTLRRLDKTLNGAS